MIHPESNQADRTCLDYLTAAAGMGWMREGHARSDTPRFFVAFQVELNPYYVADQMSSGIGCQPSTRY
jgi:hypothetical protein